MLGYQSVDDFAANRGNALGYVRRFQQLVARLVNRPALIVGNVVIFEQVLAHVEIARFDLALGVFDRARHPRMLDRLPIRHFEALHDRGDAVRSEYSQQRIFQRQIKPARTRIALAPGTAAQLVVDAALFVALGGDDMQPAGRDHLVVQLLPVEADFRAALLPRLFVKACVSLHLTDLGIGIAA